MPGFLCCGASMQGVLDWMHCHRCCQVLVCPDKKQPEENKDKASLGYDEQVRHHRRWLHEFARTAGATLLTSAHAWCSAPW